jgi:hypothetical protein
LNLIEDGRPAVKTRRGQGGALLLLLPASGGKKRKKMCVIIIIWSMIYTSPFTYYIG